jgi:hypothetical protein
VSRTIEFDAVSTSTIDAHARSFASGVGIAARALAAASRPVTVSSVARRA